MIGYVHRGKRVIAERAFVFGERTSFMIWYGENDFHRKQRNAPVVIKNIAGAIPYEFTEIFYNLFVTIALKSY